MIPKILLLLLMIGLSCGDGRWSRQITANGFSAAAINDWIPINQPCPTCHNSQESRRETSGRVLNFPQSIQNTLFQNENGQPHLPANHQSQQFSFLAEPFSVPQQYVLAQPEQINQLQHSNGVPFQVQQPPPQQQNQHHQGQPQIQHQQLNPQPQHHVQHHQLQPQQQQFLLPQQNVPAPPAPPQFKMKYQVQHPPHQHHTLFQHSLPQQFVIPQQQFQQNLPQLQPVQQQKPIEAFRQLNQQVPPPHLQQQQGFLNQNQYKYSTQQPQEVVSQQQYIKQEQPNRQPQQEQQKQQGFLNQNQYTFSTQQPPEFVSQQQYIKQEEPLIQHQQQHQQQQQQQYQYVQQQPQQIENTPQLPQQPELQQYHFIQQEPQQVSTPKIEPSPPQKHFHYITKEPQPIPVSTPKVETYVKTENASPKPEKQQYYSNHPNQIKNEEPQNEEIQLLYVPLDTLLKQEKQNQNYQNSNYYSSIAPETSTVNYSPRKTSRRPTTTSTTTTTTTTTYRPPPQFIQTAPKQKPKPHQPPLAIFMENDNYRKENRVIDVLNTLKYASTIDVIDTPSNDNPSIFIGPFELGTPAGYTKFGLPYLSNINVHENLEDMMYFVAPKSYKPPKEFNKISLPSPHVGALIIRVPRTHYAQFQSTPIPTTTRRATTTTTTTTTTTQVTPLYDNHNYFSSTPSNYYEKNQNVNDYQYNQYTSPTPPKSERTKNRYHYTADYFEPQNETYVEKHTPKYNSPVDNPEYTVEQPVFERVKSVPTTISFEEVQRMKNYFKEQQEFKQKPATPAVEQSSQKYNHNQYISSTAAVPVESYSIGTQQNQEHTYFTNSYQGHNDYQTPVQQYKPSDGVEEEKSQPPPSDYSASEVQRMKNYFKEQQEFKQRPSTPAVEQSSQNYNQNQYISSTSAVPVESYSIGSQPNQEQNYFTNTYQGHNQFQTPVQQYKPNDEVEEEKSQTPADENIASRQPHKISSSPKEQHLTVVPLEKGNTEYINSHNSFNLPSELPVISSQLPSMINSLYESVSEEEEEKTTTFRTTERVPTKSRRPIPSRRPVTTEATTLSTESYATDSTTKRVANRGRRPPPTRGTYNPVRANVVRNPNRIRYNPTSEERQQFRGRNKNKQQSAEDNLEYQRDVLNQNYPVIKPSTPITPPPTTTTTTTTTEAAEINQDYNEGLNYQTNPFAYQDRYYHNHQENINQQKLVSPSTEATPSYQDEQRYTKKYESSSTTHVPYVDESYAQQNHQNDQTQYFKEIQDHMQIPENQSKSKFSQTYPDVYYENEPTQEQGQHEQQKEQPSYNEESIDDGDNYKVAVGNPVYIPTTTELTTPSTTTTTTEKADRIEYSTDRNELFKLRRPSYVKRPAYNGYTTTESSASTGTTANQQANQDRFTVRSRKRFESIQNNTARPTLYRGRVRTRITTTTQAPEQEEQDGYNRYNNNQDSYESTTPSPVRPTRGKYTIRNRSRFQLETQESQWSPALSHHSFQPVDPSTSDEQVNEIKSPEPEIVTAGPENEDMYLVTVTPESNFTIFNHNKHTEEGRDKPQYEPTTTTTTTTSTAISSVTEVNADVNQSNDTDSFADMFDDFMSDFSNDLLGKNDQKPAESNESPAQVNNKNEIENGGETNAKDNKKSNGKRRGVWRKVRVRPVDAFETAESQNIGSQIFNSLSEKNNKNSEKEIEFQLNTFEYDGPKSPESEITTTTGGEDVLPETTVPPLVETTTVDIVDDLMEMTVKAENFDVGSAAPTSTEIFDQIQPTEIIALAETETFLDEHRKMDQNDTYHEEPPKEPSLFDEVKKKLNDLFSQPMMMDDDDDDEDMIDGNTDQRYVGGTNDYHIEQNIADHGDDDLDIPLVNQFVKPKYQNINRLRSQAPPIETTTMPTLSESVTESQQSIAVPDPIGMLIYATSTSKEVSHETEICYRGRCIKTDDKTKIN